MEICHEGLESNKDHPDGLFILAQCEQKLGNYKASEKILKSLLTSHPIYPEAIRLLANVQKKLNRSENTIKKTEIRYNRLVFSSTKKIPKKPIVKKRTKEVNPKVTPRIWGMVFAIPKLNPEYEATTLFGPGV